jgi:hypothetical protein
LEERGYIQRTRRGSGRDSDLHLADPVTALHDWTEAYSWRMNPLVSYNVPLEYREITQRIPALLRGATDADHADVSHALTLLSAADLYAAHVQQEHVHLYVGTEALAVIDDHVRRMWHGEPIDRGGNLHLVQPYYRRSVFFDARTIRDVPVVSPVQLYLDLAHYPVRGPEAASVLARTVLGPELGLSSDQVRGLIL